MSPVLLTTITPPEPFTRRAMYSKPSLEAASDVYPEIEQVIKGKVYLAKTPCNRPHAADYSINLIKRVLYDKV